MKYPKIVYWKQNEDGTGIAFGDGPIEGAKAYVPIELLETVMLDSKNAVILDIMNELKKRL
jgi:hypothetical protein